MVVHQHGLESSLERKLDMNSGSTSDVVKVFNVILGEQLEIRPFRNSTMGECKDKVVACDFGNRDLTKVLHDSVEAIFVRLVFRGGRHRRRCCWSYRGGTWSRRRHDN